MAEAKEKISSSRVIRALGFWHGVLADSLHNSPYDLSVRQMAILLTVYLEAGPHTIRALSERLGVSKPAICRALDQLERLRLAKRARDKADKRSVLVQRTVKGSVYLSEFAEIILAVSKRHA